MTTQLTLKPWPSAYNCLSWSSDDEVAVACGDRFVIITPRLLATRSLLNNRDVESIVANAFTEEEVPSLDLLTNENFSMGEEQSIFNVQFLAWSTPGLARHRRCALAVLTSNHVLSIWEKQEAQWTRKVIVNHSLIRYFTRETLDDSEIDPQTKINWEELKQVSQRVRAFSWVPDLPYVDSIISPFSKRIAVSTDAGDILLLSIQSPYDVLTPDNTHWQVQVQAHLQIGFPLTSLTSRDASPQTYRKAPPDWLVFTSWQNAALGASCWLTYVVNSQLWTVLVCAKQSSQTTGPTIEIDPSSKRLLPNRKDIKGPLGVCPMSDRVIAFGVNSVFSVDVASDPKTSPYEHHLDERWDDMTGVTFSTNGGHCCVHFTSLTSSTTGVAVLSMPSLVPVASSHEPWQDAIKRSRHVWGKARDMGMRVQERVWGFGSSAFGRYFATAITLHPTHSQSYVISADYDTFVDFSIATDSNESLASHLPDNRSSAVASSEVILFRAITEANELSDGEDATPALIEGIRNCLQTELLAISPRQGYVPVPNQELRLLVLQIRTQLFWTSEMINLRAILLAMFAQGSNEIPESHFQQVVQLLTTSILILSETSLERSQSSIQILALHQVVHGKLFGSADSATDIRSASSEELCSICGENIAFESVRWARCTRGHRFSRCCLTFLSIQRPGITKSCAICKCQYLNDLTFAGMIDRNVTTNGLDKASLSNRTPVHSRNNLPLSSDVVEPLGSFTRVLFAACNVCFYCGGKFVS